MIPQFKPKPWWLRIITPGCWVTITPYIYIPDNLNPNLYPATVAHETTHLAQQIATGKWWWLVKYLLFRSYRLDQEAQAIAVEVSLTSASKRPQVIASYAIDLSSRWYWWAASSPEKATVAINLAINKLFGSDLWA